MAAMESVYTNTRVRTVWSRLGTGFTALLMVALTITTALPPTTATAGTVIPAGCPGSTVTGPLGTAANYPCPDGGRIERGRYIPPANSTGRVAGRITFKFGTKAGFCKESDVRIIRSTPGTIVQGSATTGKTNSSTGEYAINGVSVDPGQIVVAMDACKAEDGSVYRGQSTAVTVIGGGAIDVSFEVSQPVSVAGAGDGLCAQANGGSIGWLLCAIGQFLLDSATKLDHLIIDFVNIDAEVIFDTGTPSGNAFHTAWGLFRNLAYAILIILGLIMVIAQILDLEIFSAHTLRKMLPEMAGAALVLPFIWPILALLFNLSTDASHAVGELIAAPFETVGQDVSISALLLGVGGVGGAAVYFAIGGWGVFLAVLGSIVTALVMAVLMLAARDIVAYGLIITSPVWWVLGAYGPTKKVRSIGMTLTGAILLVGVLVAMVLAATKVGAKLAIIAHPVWGIILAAIMIAVGYYSWWSIWQQALKAISFATGGIAQLGTTAQKALSDYRGNATKKRFGEAVDGKRNLPRGTNWIAGLGRRAQLANEAGIGAFGIGRQGRARYQEARRTRLAKTAASMIEQDHDRAGGDDDAMTLLARRGMEPDRFVREYANVQMMRGVDRETATARAESALGAAQSSLGARAGTDAMRVAAQRSLLKSNTSYGRDENGDYLSFDESTRLAFGDTAELVRDGLITASDGAAMIKANGARGDRAGIGFGTAIGALDTMARGGVLSQRTVTEMANEAVEGLQANGVSAQRHESAGILSGQMVRRAQEAYEADGGQVGPRFIREIAGRAAVRDAAGGASMQVSGALAAGVESVPIDDRTIQQWEEYFRTPAAQGGASQEEQAVFQRYRREYNTAQQAAVGAGAGPPLP